MTHVFWQGFLTEGPVSGPHVVPSYSETVGGEDLQLHMITYPDYATNVSAWVVGSSPVPIPPSLYMLGAGMLGLAGIRRRVAGRLFG